MATPESKVKKKISAYLNELPMTWYNMPVPSGYGRPTLDYIGAVNGYAFAIEAKAPGEKPTPRQEATMEEMRKGRVAVFAVDMDRLPLDPFKEWAAKVLLRSPIQ